MRTFAAQTTGVNTNDQIKYMAAQRQVQNNLAKSGGATTVPQFRVAGPSTGPDVNANINGLANKQLTIDAQNQYNSCVGQPSTCTGTGGTRRKRHKRRKSKTYKRLFSFF